jgi:ATP phosphoribosyltransferase
MTGVKIRLAVQKSGRLHEGSIALLVKCGIKLNYTHGSSKLKAESENFPLEMLFLRDDDIPGYIDDGVVDIGIVGENVLKESEKDIEILERLGFAVCRLSIAVPRGSSSITIPQDLNDKRIATSYPRILKEYLTKENIHAHIHVISGSVEVAPSIGLADAIFDIISSGSTLIANSLKEVKSIFHSEAVLCSAKKNPQKNTTSGVYLTSEKSALIDKLRFRLQSVLRAQNYKYILLNAPHHSIDTIVSLLPGVKSPTITPLKIEGWSSVHSVVEENAFWESIENLKAAGAEGILVLPIEKIIY